MGDALNFKRPCCKVPLNFRRYLAMFLILVLLSGSIIGCGNKTQADSTENSQVQESDVPESVSDEGSSVEAPSEGASEESINDDISDDSDFEPAADLYCAKGGDILLTEDDANVTVNYRYDELILGENEASKYPELDKALKAYFKDNAIKVKDAADEAQKFVTEIILPELKDDDYYYESLPYRIDYDISVRRFDDQVFSFISDHEEWMPMGGEEYNVIVHNYSPATGEEISFSDVVKDVDAFADILADHMIMDVEYPYYVGDVANYHESVKESIVSLAEEGDISFTIDYQGVTIYFPVYTLLGWNTAGSVIFAEDKNGTIFDKKWATSKENWISYLPLGYVLGFDKEDDGTADLLGIYAPNNENGEEVNVTLALNGENQSFEYDYSYDMEPILVHCDGETYLLLRYYKFENGFLDVFRITDEGARKIDSSSLEFGDGSMVVEGEEYNIYPQRLYTCHKDFPMETRTDMLSTGWAYGFFTFEKGKFVNKDGYLTIETSDDSDFVLTLLKDVKDAPVVDGASHEETGEKTDLTEKQTLKLMYTDNETYVDCLTKDGILVRVYVTDDEGYRSAFGYDISELFDGMFYAG